MIEPVLKEFDFLKDVSMARRDTSGFHLWWLGQSGYLLQWRARHLLIDPYLSDSLTERYALTEKPHVRMTARVIGPEHLAFVNVVTSSHSHTDHLDAETLTPILQQNASVQIVIPEANRRLASQRLGLPVEKFVGVDDGTTVNVFGFDITGVAASHETLERDQAGHYLYLGYVIRFGDWTIYHSGDTILYNGLVERLRKFPINVTILPINGRDPARGVAGNLNGREAAHLAKDVGAGWVIPCHYEMFEFNTASPDEFVQACEVLGQPHRVLRAGERTTFKPEDKKKEDAPQDAEAQDAAAQPTTQQTPQQTKQKTTSPQDIQIPWDR